MDALILRFEEDVEEDVKPLSKDEQIGVRNLIGQLQQIREMARKPMLMMFSDFRQKWIREPVSEFFQNATIEIELSKAWKTKGIKPKKSCRWNARRILPVKIAEVYSWEKYIDAPHNIEELHNMRISIKRLRYSMEDFLSITGRSLGALQVWVNFQKLLGDIHDCDISQDILTGYLKNFSQEENENTNAIGLNTLIQQYQQTCQERYQELLERWADLKEKDFRGNLLKIIENRSTTKIK